MADAVEMALFDAEYPPTSWVVLGWRDGVPEERGRHKSRDAALAVARALLPADVSIEDGGQWDQAKEASNVLSVACLGDSCENQDKRNRHRAFEVSQKMEKYFDELIASYGRPVVGPLNAATIERLRGRVPDGLVQCWKKYGIGTVLEGFFQFVDPIKYSGVCETIFEGDSEFKPERSHIVGLSAFGNLLVWNEDHNIISIDLVNLRTFGPTLTRGKDGPEKNLALIGGAGSCR